LYFAERVLALLLAAVLDYPPSGVQGCDGILGQWKAFEEAYVAKRVRSLGVSNFLTTQIQCITTNKTHVAAPTVNQLSFAVGSNVELVQANAELGCEHWT
jgi:diketogulonate reductase-like aldo/keto reductase